MALYPNIIINPLTLWCEWVNPKTGEVQHIYDEFLLEDSEDKAVFKSAIKEIEKERCTSMRN